MIRFGSFEDKNFVALMLEHASLYDLYVKYFYHLSNMSDKKPSTAFSK